MFLIKDKTKCCGCTACASICPKYCISMKEDKEGFLYPEADASLCVDCGACEKVCPVLHAGELRKPLHCYAAKNKDTDVLKKSSSGGVFSLLAQYAIQEKHGVVYGAMWEGDRVVHGAIESLDELYKLRGSKYVQSDLRDSFKRVSAFLKEGRYVLFSGTPCEIAGLKSYLRKDYDNLLTVDLACHGAPSPKVLRKYMQVLREQYGGDVQLNFRSKPEGWKEYKVTAFIGNKHFFFEGQKENLFMKGFMRELYSRTICHECPFKAGVSGADITLADFWGVENVLPEFPSYNGVSLVLTHTMKAERIFHGLQGVITKEVELEKAIPQNGALLHSVEPHPERAYFFKHIDKKPIVRLMNECLELRRITRLKLSLKAYLRKIGIK